ncbi:F-box domain-containing protein [Mycena sanguinolenta]|uniref:F-box domain-containing protein n=1 Tax=Mycena sanguinolenta TaxID=230812 RepID=A0A8H6TZP3_9AGAR|nr:F-box domain-containing protein [Mycena sanguinolenta]
MAVDSSSRVELVELAAQFELLQIWLSRSGSYPLSLDIPFQSRSSTFLLEERLLQIAVPHSERWEHVDLCLMFDNVHFLQRNMPLLRHLTFGLHQYPPKDKPVNLFDRAPRLTHVVLTSNFVKSVIDLPWHQLTHLCAHFLYIEECAEILRDAVNLVHCDFGICGSEYSIPLSTLPVHPHLTHLVLRLTGATSYRPHLSLSPFFDNLTMPALLSLRVYEPGITLDALEGSFWRSRCSLEELRIDEASEPESTYHEAFPSVKRILLYGQQGD